MGGPCHVGYTPDVGRQDAKWPKIQRQTQALANDFCAEINAELFGKELARQLSKREVEIAKKVFWELLEPHHPDWVRSLGEYHSPRGKNRLSPFG